MVSVWPARLLTAALVAVAGLALIAPAAPAAFPGANGKIVFVHQDQLWSVDSDGSGLGLLIDVPGGADEEPDWSADGQRIAFQHRVSSTQTDVWVADADGSNAHLVIANGETPSWSPDGERIAFARIGPSSSFRRDLFLVNADGTGLVQVTDTVGWSEAHPVWSPDGTKIAFTGVRYIDSGGGDRMFAGNGDVPEWSPFGDEIAFLAWDTDLLTLRKLDGTKHLAVMDAPGDPPAFSPDGTEIAFRRDGGVFAIGYDGASFRTVVSASCAACNRGVAWQAIPAPPAPRYVRPKGATVLRVPLVPAYQPCESPDREHGPPLAFGSCSSPRQTSTTATVGTPDANGRPAVSVGFVSIGVLAGDMATPEDEADVRIRVQVNDVRRTSNLEDYAWDLDLPVPLRMTYRGVGSDQATMREPADDSALFYSWPLRAKVPCAPTSDPGTGSGCSVDTTADAILGGTVRETERALWDLDRLRVFDAGPDGYPASRDDNEAFAVQGLFVP